jgi:uncharacterized coiled-coil protein SlyX
MKNTISYIGTSIEQAFLRASFFSVVLACVALAQLAQAVVPPPDGGYPGFNTAEGQNALKNLTTGSGNTGIGWYSLFSATTASFNTGLGAGALALNTADENTAIGTAALLLNRANGNTAVGSRALLNNTTGGTLGNIQGIDLGPNVAVGWEALESNTIASANTAIGYQALRSFTTGPVGFEQLGLCTAVGFQALANTDGVFANSAFGYQALTNNTSGSGNTANGQRALFSNTTGVNNTANGAQTLYFNTTGDTNTANGINALVDNTSGSDNTAVGRAALAANTTGNNNTALGTFAGGGITTANNVIAIGHVGFNVSNSCFIGHIRGVTTANTDAIPVVIDSFGQLGTMSSAHRFKREIKPMDKTSEAILALQPVTFHYKSDTTDTAQFGLIAEEVAAVNPDLVVRDDKGKIYTVRYDAVNAMLLNEFLKEHKTVQAQQATIAELKSTVAQQQKSFARQEERIAALTSGLQKVSVRVEMSKPATRVVRQ